MDPPWALGIIEKGGGDNREATCNMVPGQLTPLSSLTFSPLPPPPQSRAASLDPALRADDADFNKLSLSRFFAPHRPLTLRHLLQAWTWLCARTTPISTSSCAS